MRQQRQSRPHERAPMIDPTKQRIGTVSRVHLYRMSKPYCENTYHSISQTLKHVPRTSAERFGSMWGTLRQR